MIIKHKYLFAFLICLLCFCLYLFHTIYGEAKEKAIAELNARQMILAEQAQTGIEAFFGNTIQFLENLSASTHIVAMDDQGRKELDFAFTIKPEAIKAITRVDASGRIAYTTPCNAAVIGQDISDQKHVRQIFKTHRPVVSDVFTAVQGYRAIALHVPIFQNNEFRGTLAVLIDFLMISKHFLQGIRIGETGYAWMTSREGIELYCPVPGHIGKSVFENCKGFPAVISMANEMVRGKAGVTAYTFDRIRNQQRESIEKHAVYLPIKIVDSFWSIVVASSEDEVLATLVRFKNKLIIVVGLLLFGSALFSYYGMRSWGILREAAKRQQAEDALRKSEEQYRYLFENASEGILIAQGERIQLANPAFLTILGHPKEILASKAFTNFIHPEDRDMVVDLYRRRMKGETVVSDYSFRIIAAEGAEKWIQINSGAISWQGEPAILSFVMDITARKKSEEVLEQFKTAVAASSDAIGMSTPEGRHWYQNSAFDELFGDIGSDPPASLYVDESTGRGVFRTIMAGNPWSGEVEMYGKDKSILQILLRAYAVKDKNGNITSLVGLHTDITERKHAETEKLNMQHQLFQAQRMEAVGLLAGGIAHDFNNLLMGIQGRTSLIALDLEPAHPHREHVVGIEEYVKSASRLTKQILGFARAGKYEVKAVDLNELVLNSSAMFGRTKKEIRILANAQEPSVVAEVDRGQIEQVLINIYLNAWQAMSDGGEISIEIKSVTLDEKICNLYQTKPGRYGKISVTDTGCGMDEATCRRIFDPFFTTKDKTRGTGLGLASAYGIIQNHHGMITVNSRVGHGTTFTIYLPLSHKEADRENLAENKVIKGSETILLVDDEQMIIDVGQAILEQLGYTVVVAKGGREAETAVLKQGSEIDLVILDMIMPGMDGGKTFDRIREIRPGIRVILSSGYSIDGQADQIMRRGCNGFIQKPFSVSDLSNKIREILEGA